MRLNEMIAYLRNCGSAGPGEATFLVARYNLMNGDGPQLEDWCLAGPAELQELPVSFDLQQVDLDKIEAFFQEFTSGQESMSECHTSSFVLVRDQAAKRLGGPKSVEDKDIWSVGQP